MNRSTHGAMTGSKTGTKTGAKTGAKERAARGVFGLGRGAWLACLAVAIGVSPAFAQLEDGRGLERDLRTGPGPRGNTPRASMADEVRLRNAIVTGNVGGLKSFRGNVGYTAPEEFRGRLGSDSTFAFRRDSSSVGQVRGGESLRTQFSLTTGTGRRTSDNLMTRFGASGTAAAQAQPGQAAFATNRDLRAAPRQGTLRSTAAFAADASLSTTIVGYEQTEKGWEPVRASSLMGVRRLGTGKVDRESDLSARRRGDEPRPGLQQPLGDNALSPSSSLIKSQIGKLDDSGVVTVYDDLRRRMEEEDKKRGRPGSVREAPTGEDGAPAGTDSSSSSLDARLKELRERMLPGSDENEPAWKRILRKREAMEGQDGEAGEDGAEGDPGAGGTKDGAREGGARTSSKAGGRRAPLDDETLRLIMEAGGQTKTFIDPATGKRDVFAEQVASGQELMARARYFDSEERFAAALQARPGDVTAQAGRLHAQLGAGLYLSAALNLRAMLQQAPEVVGLRYTGATIPAPDRLAAIGAELRANAQRAKDAGLPLSSGEGLLLAYVGWQVSDRTMIQDGLTIARAGVQRAGEPGTPAFGEDEAMLELMEKAWLATPVGK